MVGFDYTDAIDFAKKKYSGIEFEHLNLNNNNSPTRTFDIVYCLETIEHVGDVNTALDNLLALSRSNGKLLISVPVEIGFWGVVKFLLKTFIYRYPWELDVSRLRYFISLVVGDRVDVYRSQQPHFSSHFGFDYRIIDDHLDNTNVNYNGYRSWTTKFYIIDG
jgi:SAM-dependent methyltransferase